MIREIYKNNLIMIIIVTFIMYNILNILGKLFLPDRYYSNGQPTIKTYYILFVINTILSLIIIALDVKKYINIPKLKINIYLKYIFIIVFVIFLVKCQNIYFKKTDNIIYYNNKFNNWLFSNNFYIKYNIETIMSQFIVFSLLIILIYNL